ncbi:MAG TPA: ParA family protein, partial [Clostridia bacterium]|nr:ParA family protein [Clostridia bacterium]
YIISEVIIMKKGLHIICGHYGSGKTNYALNLAFKARDEGEKVTIVDIDIVNPYFRTSDYTKQLEEKGIKVISSSTAGTTVDAPGLTAEMYSVFDKMGEVSIIDVGGDDVGAGALGRFSKLIEKAGYEMIYVINKYRNLISTPDEAVSVLKEIELKSKLKATAIVNNSHLSGLTKAKDILDSLDYANETARLANLPLIATTAPTAVIDDIGDKVVNLTPVDVIVKLPWN